MDKSEDIPIYKICVTGGPVSGKSTAVQRLEKHLTEKGFKVFIVPEFKIIANIKQTSDSELPEQLYSEYINLMVKTQMDIENYFKNLAKLYNKPSVILCNKGVMDLQAYTEKQHWQAFLDDYGFNDVYLRDQRYDVVIHMVTTAEQNQQEEKYENQADIRKIDYEQAILEERKIQQAWNGHQHHLIIGNSMKYENKLESVIRGVEKFIGLSSDNQLYRKFLVQDFESEIQSQDQNLIKKIFVEEVYLRSENDQQSEEQDEEQKNAIQYSYIRKRGCLGAYTYSKTDRIQVEDKQKRKVLKKNLDASQYIKFFQQRDINIKILKKVRYAFLHKNLSYVLEKFKDSNDKQICILKIDTVEIDQQNEKLLLEIPKWIKVVKEISNLKQYSGKQLGKKF